MHQLVDKRFWSAVTLWICNFITLKLKITNDTSCASQVLFHVLFQSSVCRRKHCLIFPNDVRQPWLCNCYRVLLLVFLGILHHYLYCCTVHLVDSLNITANKCTNCMSFILNHFFKTLSLLLHVSIAYRLSSSRSTYSS